MRSAIDDVKLTSLVARVAIVLSALVWSVTIVLVPSWWASPAFGAMGLSSALSALLWAVGAGLLVYVYLSGEPRSAVEVAGLAAYSVPTIAAGCSIVWFTLQENNVAAMGSAVAWLTLGLSSLARAWLIALRG